MERAQRAVEAHATDTDAHMARTEAFMKDLGAQMAALKGHTTQLEGVIRGRNKEVGLQQQPHLGSSLGAVCIGLSLCRSRGEAVSR